MNWDISIGQCKQLYGRALQACGRRFDRRKLVLNGERIEYSGRLQARYGMLKHHVQWGAELVRAPRDRSTSATIDPLPSAHRAPL